MFEDVKPELKIDEMRPGIFKIDDSGLSNAFLVIGEEKACLIDTANGLNDIGAAVKKLTDKPLIVINTHGHPDHILGNACFEQVYLNHAEDWKLARSFYLQPDEDFERSGGPIEKAMCHTYQVDENKKFACYESLILYQKDNVRKKK